VAGPLGRAVWWILDVARRGIRSVRHGVRHALAVTLFDRRLGVETWEPVALTTLGLDGVGRVGYEPSGWLDVRRALSGQRIGPDDVFLDLGCGKGRAVLQAARRPFKRVIGVELSPELTAATANNVERARAKLRCRDVELITADAATYRIPDDVTIVYTFNPFTGPVFQAVIDELIASVDRRPRTVRLLYNKPTEHEQIVRSGRFRLIREITTWRPTREWSRATTRINVYELAGPADVHTTIARADNVRGNPDGSRPFSLKALRRGLR
jgi:SAM-dependent methyltransferase